MSANQNLALWSLKQLSFSPDDIKHPSPLSQLQLEMLTCQICLLVLSTPSECATCQNQFCATCADKWLTK